MTDPIAEIDADIAAAVGQRKMTARRLAMRDDQHNRDNYDAAVDHLDNLLEMRNAMTEAERMVSG